MLAGDATREAVTRYQTELAQYLQASQDAQVLLKLPYLAKNQHEFAEMEKSVQSFALLVKHAEDRQETRLGKRIAAVRKEYAALHAALDADEKGNAARSMPDMRSYGKERGFTQNYLTRKTSHPRRWRIGSGILRSPESETRSAA